MVADPSPPHHVPHRTHFRKEVKGDDSDGVIRFAGCASPDERHIAEVLCTSMATEIHQAPKGLTCRWISTKVVLPLSRSSLFHPVGLRTLSHNVDRMMQKSSFFSCASSTLPSVKLIKTNRRLSAQLSPVDAVMGDYVRKSSTDLFRK